MNNIHKGIITSFVESQVDGVIKKAENENGSCYLTDNTGQVYFIMVQKCEPDEHQVDDLEREPNKD